MDKNVVTPAEEATLAEAAANEEVLDRAETEAETENQEETLIPPAKKPAIDSKDFVKIFSHPLFLVASILATISLAFSVEMSVEYGAAGNIFKLLFVIGMWLAYVKAKSGSVPLGGMKLFGGALNVYYILRYVACGMLFAAGGIMIFVNFTFGFTFETLFEQLTKFGVHDVEQMGIYQWYAEMVERVSEVGLTVEVVINAIFVGIAASLMFAAIVMFIINVIFTRRERDFVRSMCQNAQNGENEIVAANIVRIWLLVIGIIVAVGAVFSQSLLAGGTYAAYLICLSVWIKKTF